MMGIVFPTLQLRERLLGGIKRLLQLAGKRNEAVAVVFGVSPERCYQAVHYLKRAAPDIPVWLFSTAEPSAETVLSCELVVVDRHAFRLLVTAEKRLWRRWVVLGMATWAGEQRRWPMKIAPLLIPPFRALLMNEHQDVFRGTPRMVGLHLWRRGYDCVHSGWHRAQDLTRGGGLFLIALWVHTQRVTWFFLLRMMGHVRRGVRDPLHSRWNQIQDLGRGVAILLLVILSRKSAVFARFVFARTHAAKAHTVNCVAGSGTGVARFEYRHLHVDWKELSRIAQLSDCRWILLEETGAHSRIDDMFSLFEDGRTFAVSRQVEYDVCTPKLFARAPVRALQPGEACQVLAPASRTVLVDREKLLALGLVETCYPGAGWLVLFWKAAAAGFRSYSVGGDTEPKMLSDSPVQDSEFVTRILSDPTLTVLAPRGPDLSRGDVSFGMGRARPLRKRPRVLVISPYLPYPLSHGGAVRMYNLCSALSNRVDFILAAFREKNDKVDYAKLQEVFCEVYVVDKGEQERKNHGLPKGVQEYQSSSMRALIAELCSEKEVDLLQVEYSYLAPYRYAAPDVPAVLVEHDLTFMLHRQFAETENTRAARRDYKRWLAFESRWLRSYDGVWTMSEQDRADAVAAGG